MLFLFWDFSKPKIKIVFCSPSSNHLLWNLTNAPPAFCLYILSNVTRSLWYSSWPDSERRDWSAKDERSVSTLASSALLILLTYYHANLQSSRFRPFFSVLADACRNLSRFKMRVISFPYQSSTRKWRRESDKNRDCFVIGNKVIKWTEILRLSRDLERSQKSILDLREQSLLDQVKSPAEGFLILPNISQVKFSHESIKRWNWYRKIPGGPSLNPLINRNVNIT